MRTSKVISITLPPAMLREATRRARREGRTMSELFREAFRLYESQRDWEELRSYGRETVERLGIQEKDVVPLVWEWRREQRERRTHKVSA